MILAPLADAAALLLAVSGGPDSTALLLMAAGWARRRGGPRIEAATVDHGLRAEGADEAVAVADLCRKLGVPHHTLLWSGGKPKTRLQERAREARYALLADHARANRRRSRRHRASSRRSGRNGAVPAAARLGIARPRRHGGALDARRRHAGASAARPRQGRARRLLRGRGRRFRARSLQRRPALRPHAHARLDGERSPPKASTRLRSPGSRAAPRRSRTRSPARPRPPRSRLRLIETGACEADGVVRRADRDRAAAADGDDRARRRTRASRVGLEKIEALVAAMREAWRAASDSARMSAARACGRTVGRCGSSRSRRAARPPILPGYPSSRLATVMAIRDAAVATTAVTTVQTTIKAQSHAAAAPAAADAGRRCRTRTSDRKYVQS